ncbi:MAG: hypothetical protein M1812_008378 [Candelaria pacifica]|nr:MAG: hypothetical protein M1812_008378 [Candelaria pacifica]
MVQQQQINAMLREEPEDWVEENTWEGTDRNSETPAPGSDDKYFHVDSMEEFRDALEGKHPREVVPTKTVNKLVEKVENEQQQIQDTIHNSIQDDLILQELAQEFKELYKQHLSHEDTTDYYEKTLGSDASTEKKAATPKQIIAKHKALS